MVGHFASLPYTVAYLTYGSPLQEDEWFSLKSNTCGLLESTMLEVFTDIRGQILATSPPPQESDIYNHVKSICQLPLPWQRIPHQGDDPHPSRVAVQYHARCCVRGPIFGFL